MTLKHRDAIRLVRSPRFRTCVVPLIDRPARLQFPIETPSTQLVKSTSGCRARSIVTFQSCQRLRYPETQDKKLQEQNRKANLGSIVEELKVLVPDLLTESLPKAIISRDIFLRICPTHFDDYNSYLPHLKGRVSYYATCKAVQLVLTSVVLSPKVKLHIQSIRVSTAPDQQAMYTESTKIYVRWTTCSEGCDHLSYDSKNDLTFHSTSDAKLGSHKWSKLDTLKFVRENSDNNGQVSKTLPSLKTIISQMSTSLIGLTKENNKLERVLTGIFIFELNEENDKIVVHTIENVDLIERRETEDVDGELRVC